MKEFIDALLARIRAMREQANANLAGLKPLEQQEAAQQMRWFFQSCRETVDGLTRIASDAETMFAKAGDGYNSALQEGLKAAMADEKFVAEVAGRLVKEGKMVEKATADSMVESAKTGAEKALRDQLQAEAAEKLTLAGRRAEAAAEIEPLLTKQHGEKTKTVAQEVASALPDAALAGDGYKAGFAVLKERVGKVIGAGVASSQALQQVARMPLDKNESFDLHLGSLQEIAESFKPEKKAAGRVAPLSAPAGTEEKSPAASAPRRVIV